MDGRLHDGIDLPSPQIQDDHRKERIEDVQARNQSHDDQKIRAVPGPQGFSQESFIPLERSFPRQKGRTAPNGRQIVPMILEEKPDPVQEKYPLFNDR